jgi:Flp pilus assembly protein TadB
VLNKLTSLTLVVALIIVSCGTSAFANNSSNPDAETERANLPAGAPAKEDARPNEQLKNNMLKLVTEAKAGKVAPAAKSQLQPAKRNNLSQGTKIAIGVGVAIAVIAVILIAKSPALNDGQ